MSADELRQAAETGALLIASERARQMSQEGWTPAHDAEHANGALAQAAVCYATPPESRAMVSRLAEGNGDRGNRYRTVPVGWPWHPDWYKPTPDDRVRELVKTGALIAAEIDRLINGVAS